MGPPQPCREPFRSLSETILRHLDRLSAPDVIAALSSVARQPQELRSALPLGFVEELLQALRARGYGPWRLDLEAVVQLLEALHGMRTEDEQLLELVLDRLQAALVREVSLRLLLRLMESLGDLPKRMGVALLKEKVASGAEHRWPRTSIGAGSSKTLLGLRVLGSPCRFFQLLGGLQALPS